MNQVPSTATISKVSLIDLMRVIIGRCVGIYINGKSIG